MAHNQDRRNAPRVQLRPTIGGELSHFAVTVADVSVTGARIQHETPLMMTPGKRFVLDFVCNGERFVLPCTVARSRLETNKVTRRLTYTTGIRFVDIDEFTVARLWAAIRATVVDVLAQDTAPLPALGFEILSH
jgi:hypothetical protein